MTDWTADANDALHLSLVSAPLGDDITTIFHPNFTYPIYGEDEKIYGYQDLTIDLRFASGSLVQYLNLSYSKKLASSTIDDVEGTLARFIPSGYYKDEATFLQQVEDDAQKFRPYGNLIYSYTRTVSRAPGNSKGKATSVGQIEQEDENLLEFEAYHATWSTPGFKEYHRRLQLFVLLYIEGGSYINDEEDSWEFMVLYEKRRRKGSAMMTYHFVGYSSLYNFYHFPEKVRMRLSQFIILPPYQRQAHGSELYKTIYQYVCSQPHIAELTVEDPAEAFEDLRDKNDLKMLFSCRQFMQEGFGEHIISHGGGRVGKARRITRGDSGSRAAGKLGPPADKVWVEKWRRELKIAGRQFQRLVEMLMLSHLDPLDIRGLKGYRLQVKERLYRFNYEILAQLDKQERLDKLEETFQNVREDYQRILKMAGCF
ncbi:hypothetical protein AX15_005012 [Amanita polypyramis BW_CC]|nr:hypothetical protein AX15_005012 [Amanita polypyramis BW_CC]